MPSGTENPKQVETNSAQNACDYHGMKAQENQCVAKPQTGLHQWLWVSPVMLHACAFLITVLQPAVDYGSQQPLCDGQLLLKVNYSRESKQLFSTTLSKQPDGRVTEEN